MQTPYRERGEVAVMQAGPGEWWVHTFDAHHDSGQLLSSHRLKRHAVTSAARAARDLDLDLVVWGDA